MNLTTTAGNQVWGIYHTDLEYARKLGDPHRTIVETSTKIATEEAASKLGFSDPWANPISQVTVKQAQLPPNKRLGHRQEIAHKSLRVIHI